MLPFVFTLFGLGSAVGLYFIFIGAIVAIFIAALPFIAVYGLYRAIHDYELFEEDEMREKLVVTQANDTAASFDGLTRELSALEITRSEPLLSKAVAEDMIHRIEAEEVDQLLEALPAMNHHEMHFSLDGDTWRVQFKLNSFVANFDAVGSGASPKVAFEQMKERLEGEIAEWHLARQEKRPYVAHQPESRTAIAARSPRVLIVEDDIDMAIGLRDIFQQLGCKVNVATEIDFAHEQLASSDNDFILLDWMLGENLNGGQLLDRAVHAIESASDLKDQFSRKRPIVVTHSSLERGQIAVSESPYFEHVDHWHKPASFRELANRSFQLLQAYAI